MQQIETIDTVVVGAGVVGLACARALAQAGHEVVILEALDAFGTVTSARNSEVIHAGLYYKPGSLKARLCVRGKHALYDYCAERGIGHRRCGKLVVATDAAQIGYLESLQAAARLNGVEDTTLLGAEATRALEPSLRAVAALHSPSTGIVDSHGLMTALLGDAQAGGAVVVFKSPIERARVVPGGIELDVGGEEPMRIGARQVVNAAGLQAPAVASRIEGLASRHVPAPYFCKGSYFTLSCRSPFTRLVYPVPESAGLGIHLTLDLAGQARFGPDTQWLHDGGNDIDYAVDAARGERFYAEIRRYWPGLPDHSLMPAYSGVRPKIQGPTEPAADFVISGPSAHAVPGLVNLFGIESPGLTASLAIADAVLRELLRDT